MNMHEIMQSPENVEASESDLREREIMNRFNMRFISLRDYVIPGDLFEYLPIDECRKYHAIPYSIDNNVLQIITSNPLEFDLAQKIESRHGLYVRLHLAKLDEIDEVLKRSSNNFERLNGLTQDFVHNQAELESNINATASDIDVNDSTLSPVITFINTLLVSAISKRASDIHIEAHENGLSIKYRIDGVLYPATELLAKKHHSSFVSRLKVMAELDIAEKRVPQDGRFSVKIEGRYIDFRLSVLPAAFGEDVVIRILDKHSIANSFDNLRLIQLGISERILKKFERSIREPYGMVLITGPTGSGKTTTLYAALSEINSGEEKIITIEDPVEYQLRGITQIPVNEKKGLTFAKGLRSILRHDPDQIMIGEIRDGDTATIAVQAALTGHLVFTTVHANNSFDVISRFIHMGIEPYSFISSLNCVMAQRLVRLICEQCKDVEIVPEEYLEYSGLNDAKYKSHTWFHGKGCSVCNGTGYRGRSAVTELLNITPDIRQMLIDKKPMSVIKNHAISEGLVSLRESAIEKAMAGSTTLREINRVTFVE